MLTEENPRHHDASHVHRNDEELLLAAGATCATLVLCARSGVYTGPYADTPEDRVHVADVAGLPYAAFRECAGLVSNLAEQAQGERILVDAIEAATREVIHDAGSIDCRKFVR